MSYTALARKWRPKSFAELVGQEHVRRALVNALDSGRVHHAFLFTGTRSDLSAFVSARRTCSWPIISANCFGRHLRASAM